MTQALLKLNDTSPTRQKVLDNFMWRIQAAHRHHSHDVACPSTEVECDGSLIRTKVVDVEHQLRTGRQAGSRKRQGTYM